VSVIECVHLLLNKEVGPFVKKQAVYLLLLVLNCEYHKYLVGKFSLEPYLLESPLELFVGLSPLYLTVRGVAEMNSR
jgi:hypothetical protein